MATKKKTKKKTKRKATAKRKRANPLAGVTPAKTNRWYPGPHGVRVRVRRLRGRVIVDVKRAAKGR